MKLKHQLLAACLACVLPVLPVLPGCASPSSGDAAPAHGAQQADLGDPELAAKFVLVGIEHDQRDGLMCVRFDLKNTTAEDLTVDWAVQWKDGKGEVVKGHPRWQTVRVAREASQALELSAPTPEAAVFQLLFRKAGSGR